MFRCLLIYVTNTVWCPLLAWPVQLWMYNLHLTLHLRCQGKADSKCVKETACCSPSSSSPVAAPPQSRLLISQLKREVSLDLPATFPRKQSILLGNVEPSETLKPLIEDI